VAALAPFPRGELDGEMHMRTPEGKWLRGFEAWLVLLRVLPKLSWLGRIASVAPLRWLGPSVYGFIARHRTAFPARPRAAIPIRVRLPPPVHSEAIVRIA